MIGAVRQYGAFNASNAYRIRSNVLFFEVVATCHIDTWSCRQIRVSGVGVESLSNCTRSPFSEITLKPVGRKVGSVEGSEKESRSKQERSTQGEATQLYQLNCVGMSHSDAVKPRCLEMTRQPRNCFHSKKTVSRHRATRFNHSGINSS